MRIFGTWFRTSNGLRASPKMGVPNSRMVHMGKSWNIPIEMDENAVGFSEARCLARKSSMSSGCDPPLLVDDWFGDYTTQDIENCNNPRTGIVPLEP